LGNKLVKVRIRKRAVYPSYGSFGAFSAPILPQFPEILDSGIVDLSTLSREMLIVVLSMVYKALHGMEFSRFGSELAPHSAVRYCHIKVCPGSASPACCHRVP
jgi:hypothetical protein